MSITDPHLIAQYQELHNEREYGNTSPNHSIALRLAALELCPSIILDYGCGRANLSRYFKSNTKFYRYDPAILELSVLPIERADLVINTDVMEHIPRQDVSDVLADIRRISEKVFFVISTRPASTILPNGENAHCTVESAEWWLHQILMHFDDASIVYSVPNSFCVLLTWPSAVSDLYPPICEHALPLPKKEKGMLSLAWRGIRRIIFRRIK